MTVQSRAIQVLKVLTGAIWFALGAVFGIILYNLFTMDIASDYASVQFKNNSSAPIYAAVFLPDGHVSGASIEQGADAFVTIHEGQVSDPDFPSAMRVLIADDSDEAIINMEFPIVVENGILVSRPVSFEIGEAIESGEQVKTIKFEIKGSKTP